MKKNSNQFQRLNCCKAKKNQNPKRIQIRIQNLNYF